MNYYKVIVNDELINLQQTESPVQGDFLQEITEQEYTVLSEKIAAEAEAEAAAVERSKDERIAELEQENAALLFEVLTGEAYSDV